MDNDNDPREKSAKDHEDRSGDDVVPNLPTDNYEIEENENNVATVDGDIDNVIDKVPQGDKESDDVHNQTLETLSEEFDQFLSTFHVNDDDGDNENDKAEDYLQIPHIVGIFLELVEEKLSSYDSREVKINWCQDPEEMHTLIIASVDRVSKLMSLLLKKKSCLDRHELLINHVGSVQQRAMAFLEDEFRVLLDDFVRKESPANDNSSQRKSTDQTNEAVSEDHDQIIEEGTDNSGTDYPGYPEEVVNVLKRIADEMTRGGYGRECREVFSIARRNMLLKRLKDDEFEKVSFDEVQKMNWETLEGEIPIWIKTFKNCSSLFFPEELKLTQRIFPGDQGNLFCNITHCLAIHLLGFAEAVSMTIRSTEKLFKILDMYETLRDGFPEIVGLFPEEYRSELSNEMTSARSGLGDFAILIFYDLENSIKSDCSKTPVPGGAVHPLTRYTMNYLKYSFDEIHKTQSSWVVNDEQLQSELRVSITAVIIPA